MKFEKINKKLIISLNDNSIFEIEDFEHLGSSIGFAIPKDMETETTFVNLQTTVLPSH